METKTVKVHGHFNDMKPQFRRGLYVEAAIFTGDERVTALPEDAVVRDEGKTYIFTREGHQEDHQGEGIPFRGVEVATGIRRNGMVRILRTNGLPADADIVVEGASDIFAERNKRSSEGGVGKKGVSTCR